MAGLLDWLQTPGGMGLLSAAAGTMAGARRGQPWNTAGRGALAGLAGYASANDQIRQDQENAFQRQYREMQMDQMRRQMEQQKAMREAGQAAAAKAMPMENVYVPNGNQSPLMPNLGGGTDGIGDYSMMGNAAPVSFTNEVQQRRGQFDPNAYSSAMMAELAQRGFADEALKYAPKADDLQLVTVYDNGQPLQKWVAKGKSDGVTIGAGKPEAESYKERTVSPDGRTYVKQYSQDGGRTWRQIEGTAPYDIRASSGASDITVNGFPKETFKNERDLRNDFQGLPTTKAFREVQTSYDQIKFALTNPSAANDLAAATKFMKLLDPGSVVRESELGMAMAATGQLDRMTNYYNMLRTGQKLTPSQRTDFYRAANGLYQAATERYNQSAQEYRGMAGDYGLNPDRIAKPAPAEKPDQPAKPAGNLTQSEQAELEQLRKRFKK